MLGGADNPNGELLSYIIGADRALGTSFSQALLKTQERVKTHTDAFLALKNHGVSVGSVYSNRSLERVPLLL